MEKSLQHIDRMGLCSSIWALMAIGIGGAFVPMAAAHADEVKAFGILKGSAKPNEEGPGVDRNSRPKTPEESLGQARRTDTRLQPLVDSEKPAALTCPSGPVPPPPTLAQQMEVVDEFAPKLDAQVRTYPTMPHLDPKLVAEAMISGNYRDDFKFVIAHRGEHTEPGYAENGLSGIWKAYQAGSDGVEIDIKTDCQQNTLLGHDFAVGREQSTSSFDLFENYPATDPVYTLESRWPFRMNNSVDDVKNPNRLTNYIADYWNKPLNDQYDQAAWFGDTQLTAFQAMYFAAKYTPMMIWLDVKSSSDLLATAVDVREARAALPGNTTLDYVGFKLGAGALRDAKFNPPKFANLSGLLYYAVLGLGDLDQVKKAGDGDLAAGLKTYCDPKYGCLGVELAHKYEGAPTQPAADFVKSTENLQLSGFHTVPQYDWASFVGQEDSVKGLQYIRNFNRTFPRTDGSCCFTLDDSFNIGLGQSELLDRRGSYNWNILNFNAFTSDDATNLLRSLYAKGYRPNDVIHSLGGLPPAGVNFNALDGLYAIFDKKAACYVEFVDIDEPLACNNGVLTKRAIWYRTYLGTSSLYQQDLVQISSVSKSAVVSTQSPFIGAVDFAQPGSTPHSIFYSQGETGSFDTTLAPATSASQQWITQNGQIAIGAGGISGSTYRFVPLRQAQLESELAAGQTENRIGPPGSILWCDEGQTCGETHFAQVDEQIAYGVNGSWVYKYVSPEERATTVCSVASFGTDPAPGQSKACYRQPVYEADLNSDFALSVPEGQPIPPAFVASPITYGVSDSNFNWVGNFGPIGQITRCDNFIGAPDPMPGLAKHCRISKSNPTPKISFSYCAGSNSRIDICPFRTPHTVALQYFGSDGRTRYTYKTFSRGVRCSPDEFGVKNFGEFVKCYARVVSELENSVDNYSWCASLNGKCVITDTPPSSADDKFLAAYKDDGGHLYFAQLSGTFTCKPESFGQEGEGDPSGTCFYRLY